MRGVLAILLLLASSKVLYCQQENKNDIYERLSEVFLQYAERNTSEEELDEGVLEEFISHYNTLLSAPLDINKAVREDLENLSILSEFQISAILDYRKEYGSFLSLNELYQIPGLDPDVVSFLCDFLTTGQSDMVQKIKPSSLFKDGKSQVLIRSKCILEKQKGYEPITKKEYENKPDSRYGGSKIYLYGQYKYLFSDRLQANLTIEKDAGEKGIDYISWNLTLLKSGVIKKLIVGDYTARFGQGLVMWNSFYMSQNYDPDKLKKSGTGIIPYSSTDENRSFKGVAVTLEKGNFCLSLYGSYRTYDARISGNKYTSLLKTGLHNTKTTMERKGNLAGTLLGSNISLTTANFRISSNASFFSYDHPYGGRDSIKHSCELSSNGYGANLGADFYWILGRVRCFGEYAVDRSFSGAHLCAVEYSVNDKIEAAFALKGSSEYYYAPYAIIERGAHASLRCMVGRYWKVSSGLSFAKDYRNISVVMNFNKGKGKTDYCLKISNNMDRTSIRNSVTYPVSGLLRFSDRVDFAFAGNKTGIHLYHEAIFESRSKKITGSLRVAAFDVPEWKTRIYSYERDVLYNFSSPLCYGQAIRYYLNLRYSPLRCMDFWVKVSSTCFLDRDKIGEGPDLISGPSKSEAKIQLRLNF